MHKKRADDDKSAAVSSQTIRLASPYPCPRVRGRFGSVFRPGSRTLSQYRRLTPAPGCATRLGGDVWRARCPRLYGPLSLARLLALSLGALCMPRWALAWEVSSTLEERSASEGC